MKIHVLDLRFQNTSQTIAAFLVESAETLTLVETGPFSVYAELKAGIEDCGFRAGDIGQVLLTHIHLDHAGAAWAFAADGADIYVHPLGAAHLEDPSRLMSSARRIYREEMDRLWGDMRAIDPARLKIVDHAAGINFGTQRWRAWHTPGHAVHHIAWQLEDVVFTGDVAGVRIDNGLIVPPCPPPDINIEDWRESIRLLRELNPKALYLTHFGRYTDVAEHLEKLEERLLEWAEWMRPYFEAGADVKEITPKFEAFVGEQLKQAGIAGEQLAKYGNANPPWMSVAGLLRYWRKKLGA